MPGLGHLQTFPASPGMSLFGGEEGIVDGGSEVKGNSLH